MARLQILDLPTVYRENGPDETPFILILDEYTPERYILGPDQPEPADQLDGVAEKIGARAVLAFEDTIDIPANEITPSGPSEPLATVLQLDDQEVRSSIAADVHRANGTEDGPKDWHGILQTRRRQLTKALGISPHHDWDGILEAATNTRRAHDGMRDAIQRVRDLHRPVEHQGRTVCSECSAYDGAASTDNPPVRYDQCETIRATRDPQATGAHA